MKKLIVKIKKTYHYFFHSWEETGWNQVNVRVKRKCRYCGKEQILVDYEPGAGFQGPAYFWEDITPKNK